MNKRIILLLSAVFVVFLGSCNKDDSEKKWKEEEQRLAQYMATNKPEVPLTDGIYFESRIPGSDMPTSEDAYVLINFNGYQINMSGGSDVLETTTNTGNEIFNVYPTYKEGGPELRQCVKNSSSGFSIALSKMHEGESARVYMSSRYLYSSDFISRRYDLRIEKIIGTGADLIAYREDIAGKYLKSLYGDDIDTVKFTSNGTEYKILYHIISKGTGASLATETSSVKTHTAFSHLFTEYPKEFTESMEYFWPMTEKIYMDIFENMNKGGRVIIAMPAEYPFVNAPFVENNETKQHIVPIKSVALFDITVDN